MCSSVKHVKFHAGSRAQLAVGRRDANSARRAGVDIEDAPSFGSGVRTEYLLGLGKSQRHVKLLLDIDRVLAADELSELTVELDG